MAGQYVESERWVSRGWLLGLLVTLVGALGWYGVTDTRAQIADCHARITAHITESNSGFQRIARLEARLDALERENERLRREQR